MDEWETVSTVLDWQWYSLFCSAASVTHIIASTAHHLLQVLLRVALQLAERSPEQKNMTGRRVEVCLSVTSETKVTGMILKTATTATAQTCCLAGKSGTSFVWEVYAWGQTWPISLKFSLFRCVTLEKTHNAHSEWNENSLFEASLFSGISPNPDASCTQGSNKSLSRLMSLLPPNYLTIFDYNVCSINE